MKADRIDEFIEKYKSNTQQIEEFKTRDQLSDSIVTISALIATLSVILLLLDVLNDIGQIFRYSNTSVAVGGMIISVILILIARTIHQPEFSRKEVLFHYFAVSLDYFYNEEDYQGVYNSISEIEDYLNRFETSTIHPTHQELIGEYIETLDNVETDQQLRATIAETYPDVVEEILEITMNYENTNIDETIKNINAKAQSEPEVTYRQVIYSSFSEYLSFDRLRTTFPLILVAFTGLAVFQFVNNQLGMFVVIVGIPLIQRWMTNSDVKD